MGLRQFSPFVEAREFVHSLGLQSEKEWRKYKKSGKKPQDIPSEPVDVYKNEWKGMGDWLGTAYFMIAVDILSILAIFCSIAFIIGSWL